MGVEAAANPRASSARSSRNGRWNGMGVEDISNMLVATVGGMGWEWRTGGRMVKRNGEQDHAQV
jgi:hypothetical protein